MSAVDPPRWGVPDPYAPTHGPAYVPEARHIVSAAGPLYGPPMTAVPAAPRQGPALVVAVVSIVVAVIALGVSFFAVGLASLGSLPSDPGYSGAYTLPGKLPKVPTAAGVSAADLQRSVTVVLENDGSEVDALSCPATAKVAQGVVTPCQATLDREVWSVVVIFEDATGRYLALVS